MKYEYTTVYRITGIEYKNPEDIEVLSDVDGTIHAYLTNNPNRFTHRVNSEHVAVLHEVAGLLDHHKQSSSLAEQLRHSATTKYKELEHAPYVVIQIAGEDAEWMGEEILDRPDFVVYLNGNDPSESIRFRGELSIASLLTSLALETGGAITTEKVWDNIAMVRGDGKRVFPFNCSVTATIADVDPLTDDAHVRITNSCGRLSSGKRGLRTVVRLFVQSTEAQKDKLRSFLFGWSALETFVNTVFAEYEEEMFDKLGEGSVPELRALYVTRVRDVMKGKYCLVDKFIIVALALCTTDAREDVETFRAAKKARDRLFHGSTTDKTELPADSTHDLLVKYLQLHLGDVPRPATARTLIKLTGLHNPLR